MRNPKNHSMVTGDKNYADRLVSECLRDPERAASAILPLCERVCNTNLSSMNSILAKLHEMEDGTAVSKISGVTPEVGGDYAKFLRDALVVPIILTTLSKSGLMLALPKDKVKQPAEPPASLVALNALQAREAMWEQADALESQLEGFINFQATTDVVSPYGQLIIKLATTVLAEIKIRKATRHTNR